MCGPTFPTETYRFGSFFWFIWILRAAVTIQAYSLIVTYAIKWLLRWSHAFSTMCASIWLALLTGMKCLLHAKYLYLFFFFLIFFLHTNIRQAWPRAYAATYLSECFYRHHTTVKFSYISFINHLSTNMSNCKEPSPVKASLLTHGKYFLWNKWNFLQSC